MLSRISERTALNPGDMEIDLDEWPELKLTNVTVKNQRGTHEDLLEVDDRGPFKVVGTLSKIPDEFNDIIRARPVEKIYQTQLYLKSVDMYAVGTSVDDGKIKIWVLGESAWYSIQPSKDYKPIFETMIEKANIWLFLQDEYDEYSGRGRKIPGTVNELYTQYAQNESTCPNGRAAGVLFDKHHRYLCIEMCRPGNDPEMWQRTPLFRHYALKYSLEFSEIQKSMTERESAKSFPAKKVALAPPRSVYPRKKPKQGCISYGIFERLKEYVSIHELQPIEITKERIVQFLFENYEFDSCLLAARNIDARAQDILCLMDAATTRNSFNWSKTPAYKDLEDIATFIDDAAERRKRCVERTFGEASDDDDDIQAHSPITTGIPVESLTSGVPVTSTDECSDSEEEPPRKQRSTKGKSSLRPSFTPAPLEAPSPSKNIDDDALLKFLSRKRAFEDLVSPGIGALVAKKPRTRADAPSSTPSSNLIFSTPSLCLKSGHKSVVSVTRSPTVGSNRSSGHWVCEIDGCKHSIHDAKTDENLRLIRQHYKEHGKAMEIAMEAIGGEVFPRRPEHRISNLLAKIEHMTKKLAMSIPAPFAAKELRLPTPAASSSSV